MLTVRELNELKSEYIIPYSKPQYFIDGGKGFIVWRMGTGRNVELLHIKASESRRGYGRSLLYHMLSSLQRDKATTPYHSVFGFTRVSNERAKEFYTAMGFCLQPIEGLYKDGKAVMFWQEFNTLVDNMTEYLN